MVKNKKVKVIESRISELGIMISKNERIINELVDNNWELKIIKKGLEGIIKDEDKEGVKEGRKKGWRD